MIEPIVDQIKCVSGKMDSVTFSSWVYDEIVYVCVFVFFVFAISFGVACIFVCTMFGEKTFAAKIGGNSHYQFDKMAFEIDFKIQRISLVKLINLMLNKKQL